MAAISEYYILKNIFSYLLPEDLNNVSLVCKEWCLVARKVQQSFSRFPFVGQAWTPDVRPKFNRQMRPKIILHFKMAPTKSRKRKRVKERELLDIVFEEYPVHYRSLGILVVEYGFFFAAQLNNFGSPTQLKIGSKNNMMESLLLINEIPGFKVDMATDVDFRKWESSRSEKVFNRDFDQVKGLIYLSRCNETRFINHSLKNLIMKYDTPLVGGDTVHLVCDEDRTTVNSIMIGFRGEKLDVQNAISQNVNDVEDVCRELAKKAGPIPDRGTRFAFIFSCVDRMTPSGEFETDAFHRHFPGIPCFGFFCLGEYYRPKRDSSTPQTNRLRYYQSATILVLTIKK